MTEFIYGTELNLALEDMISSASEYLWFISPYIKLHDRIKDELKRRKEQHELEIIIVFGKNEDDVSKSMSKEDINFLKEFPNVQICYEKNLHAKFYASEKFSLLTSMNLHQFSQNTNIEAGIQMFPKSTIKQLANIALNSYDVGENALAYFEDIIKHSEKLYKKTPQYESTMLGLKKKFTGSKVEFDKLDSIAPSSKFDYKSSQKSNNFDQSYSKSNLQNQEPQTGYCIRTGNPIEFNPSRPFCYEAYQTWAQFENWDFAENYCHLTGKPSFGKTSMRNPIM